MIRKILLSIFAIFSVAVSFVRADEVQPVRKSLSDLDGFIAMRDKFIQNRRERIDSLKTILENTEPATSEWFTAMEQISEGYTAFNNDSTLKYYERALQTAKESGLDSLAQVFRMKLLAILPLTGYIVETVNTFNNVDTTGFSDEMKIHYLDNARQMYNYITAFYRSEPNQAEIWRRKEMEAQAELMGLLPPSSDQYRYCESEYLFHNGQFRRSKEVSLDLLEGLSPDSNLYARVCHNLAEIAKMQGNEEERIYYLTRSAITDVKTATLEITSLQELGVHLFDHDDLEHAYNYLSVALENAVACNAPLRILEVSEALPLIESAHYRQNSNAYHLLQYLLIAACVLLVLLGVSLFMLKRQINRKTMLQNRLEGANLIKEVYISHFLNLCSSYSDKLNSFNEMVKRKITAGQVDELLKLSKSSRFMEEQTKEFYEVFDNAFLHIYPTFVEEVNRLLLPDQQIEMAENNQLNTDFRILALMRLGVEDANRVAHMLNYSVNTIYAYKNRIRNRAINRDSFEEDVMKISSL